MGLTKQTATESPKLGALPGLSTAAAGDALVVTPGKDGYEHTEAAVPRYPLDTASVINVGSGGTDDFATIQEAFDWLVTNFYPAGASAQIKVNDITGMSGGLSVAGGDWSWITVTTNGLISGDPGVNAFYFYGCGSPVLDFFQIDQGAATTTVIFGRSATVRMRQDCSFTSAATIMDLEECHLEMDDTGSGASLLFHRTNTVGSAVTLRNTSASYKGESGTMTVIGGMECRGANQGDLVDLSHLNLEIQRNQQGNTYAQRVLSLIGSRLRCSTLTLNNTNATSTDALAAVIFPASLECLGFVAEWAADVTEASQNLLTIEHGCDLKMRGQFSAFDSTGGITLGAPIDLPAISGDHGGVWLLPSDITLPAGVTPNSFNGGDVLVVGGV